ncbi:hypothetical protein [Delftia tsuruhatensis]|uniref:hypothetical protein n=1 Tax=Delftia tsuruhatensis TaxID=180282 RepID=UPI0023DA4FFC|nr:hypothetical protein [Delftia tsuruhatensis]WEM01125.1 hypothetical protein PW274_12830 [Delftia tsuruhatensis]
MNIQIRFAGVDGQPPQPMLVVDFAATPVSMPIADQELELRIQAQAMLMSADMLAFQRTENLMYRRCAEQSKTAMYALIARRSPERQAEMTRALGGGHA